MTTTWTTHETTSAALGALAAEGRPAPCRGAGHRLPRGGPGRTRRVRLHPGPSERCSPAAAPSRPTAGGTRSTTAAGRPGSDTGSWSGRLAAGALEVCHPGALFDAAYFVLAHDTRDTASGPAAVHWLGAVRSVPVDVVVRESDAGSALLDRIWPDPDIDTVPLTRVPDAGGRPAGAARPDPHQVDGVRTAAEIASALACRTYHTLVELRRLAADGLAHRRAARSRPRHAGPEPPRRGVGRPDTALLRRLRDALEAL
ncbi:hypothetical protein LV779_26055 [Streptomyces thinghirensis]|nr:hypothetical protein [Streptomyces thinghirensis]